MHRGCRTAWLFLIALGPAAVGLGDTFEVDVFSDNPLIDDCTPAPGDCSLRGAVLNANASPGQDTILLPAGGFALTLAGSDEVAMVGDLDLNDDVILEGAGPGFTVLDGELLFDRFFTANAAVEIRDMSLVGAESLGVGGALLVDFPGSALLERVEVLGNRSELSGGGAFALGDLTLRDCAVAGNVAEGPGGGLVVGIDAVLTLEDTLVVHNGTMADLAGGLYVTDSSTLIALRSVIDDNRTGLSLPLAGGVGEQGAGVYVGAGALAHFEESSIRRNRTSGPASAGGGIRALGQIQLVATTLAWNRAEVGSAVSLADGAVAAVVNSTLSGNSGPFPLTGTFAVDSDSSALLRASTVRALPGDRALLAVGGLIVVEDSAFEGGCRFLAGASVPSIGGNVSAPTACWTDSAPQLDDEVVADLLVSQLADFGGPTFTHLPLPGSPLLDHALGACTDFDQRGEPRAACDSGAVERQAGDPEPIFVGHFESGTVDEWSASVGGPGE